MKNLRDYANILFRISKNIDSYPPYASSDDMYNEIKKYNLDVVNECKIELNKNGYPGDSEVCIILDKVVKRINNA